VRAVRALFLHRQHLARPRAADLTARALVRFVEDVGGLQLDSINVLDRALVRVEQREDRDVLEHARITWHRDLQG